MRRRIATSIVAAGAVAASLAGTPAASAATLPASLRAGSSLHVGQRLTSPAHRYYAVVQSDGRFVIRTVATNRYVWGTPPSGSDAALFLATNGSLYTRQGGVTRWNARTYGSGSSDVLTMGDSGVLALTSGGALVWSSRLPNACPASSGKTIVVDISEQSARACRSGQQIRASWVTTGMSAYGYGTPTGTWHVYAHTRNTTLYPAAGGAYPVKYWMPYSGPYGFHDSSWQTFPYGSSQYRTGGSHGCVHTPLTMMAWLFAWAPNGTRVTIHG